MTDREPDDLYDALRDRLAGYGQEPPAPLWAGIRAQLPPPVAAPQLRRRRWRRAAWLGVLLLVVGLGSWQGWRVGHRAGRPGTDVAATDGASARNWPTAPSHVGAANAARRANPAAGTRPGGGDPGTAPGQATTRPAIPSGTPGNATETVAAAVPTETLELNQLTPSKPARVSRNPAALVSEAAVSILPRAPGRVGPASAGDIAAVSRSARRPLARPGLGSARATVVAGNSSASSLITRTPEALRRLENRRDSTFLGAAVPGDRTLAVLHPKKHPSAQDTPAEQLENAAVSPRSTRVAALSPASPGSAHAAELAASAFVTADSPTGPGSFAAWSLLQPRPVALNHRPWASLPVVAGTDTLPRPVPAPVRRWAVQVLTGPALTYRRLGAPAGAAPPRVANLFDRTGAAAAVATLERPAVGFGAQVQARRVLTGRWALSAGLGYHEYATSLALTTVVATTGFPVTSSVPPRNDSTTTRFRLRDTYRFLTVPVRLGYQLGADGRHLRFGVLAGADVAFYLGGATTEGSACGCATQPWGRTGSPYRPLSLALSLGADLRYQLGPRWELLAQPTATYFLTSLARPASGFAPRYLLGGSTLLGFAYGLR